MHCCAKSSGKAVVCGKQSTALVLHTLDCAKWMPWDHDMHHCAKSRGNAVVCGKQLPALVLWSHI